MKTRAAEIIVQIGFIVYQIDANFRWNEKKPTKCSIFPSIDTDCLHKPHFIAPKRTHSTTIFCIYYQEKTLETKTIEMHEESEAKWK